MSESPAVPIANTVTAYTCYVWTPSRGLPTDPGPGNALPRRDPGTSRPAMMNCRDPSSERGQILITTAAGLIVLAAIAAIVVDLGMSWMLKRGEQNAAGQVPCGRAVVAWPVSRDATMEPGERRGHDACFYTRSRTVLRRRCGCAAAYASGKLGALAARRRTVCRSHGKSVILWGAHHPSLGESSEATPQHPSGAVRGQ